jgi:basic membrane protein A
MKKVLVLLVALAMALTLTACSGKKDPEPKPDDPTPAETGYDIAFLADLGTINDGGFNQGTWEGCQKYAKEKNMTVNYLQPAEDSDDARKTILTQAVEQWKAKVCVACGYLWDNALAELCPKYPDVKFIFIDGDASVEGIANVAPICFKEQEVGFLAGYAAVKDGYKNLAFFGGMGVPAVVRFGYGFVWGADYAAQELGLSDINIKYWYSGSFDPTPEKMTTVSSWYETGTEIVFSCGGTIVQSAIQAAEAGEGRYLIGVDIDESHKSERIVTSAMKSITNATYDGIVAAIGGGDWSKFSGKVIAYGTENNGVQLPDDFSRFKSFTKAEYEAIFADLAADKDGISSSIPTDATTDRADKLPVKAVHIEDLD